MSKQAAIGDIPELTSLRVIAALCVVVSHLHGLGIVSAAHLHEILDGGRPAVSFFFVLSGFIMNHKYPDLHWGNGRAITRYAQSRFARLYPTLLLSLFLALPTGIYMACTHAGDQLLRFYALKGHINSWLIVSALAQIFGLTGWTPAAAVNQPWNGPAWSLSCEFFFYSLFPFIRPGLQRRSAKTLIILVLTAWMLQGVWIAGVHEFIPPNRAGFLVSQFPLTHLFEFVLGVSAGILVTRFNIRQLTVLICVTSFLGILAFASLHTSNPAMPAYYGLSPLFAAVVMATASASGSPWLLPLRHRVLLALGHSSYSLYMIHAPILIGACVFGLAAGLGWFWVPILMLTSYLLHCYFAEPVRRRLLYGVRHPSHSVPTGSHQPPDRNFVGGRNSERQ